jgi:hypothetical protein
MADEKLAVFGRLDRLNTGVVPERAGSCPARGWQALGVILAS